MIELQGVCAGYGSREILHKVNLVFPAGEITALIGPNGCGKTTLLRAVCGLIPLREGRILFRGKPRQEYGRREFARLAAFLPQVRDVPSLSVKRFVTHGRYPHLRFGRDLTETDARAVALAMEQAGVSGLADKELRSLSGGQRQRVYLAMTLAQEAEILLLDEPTTYLDVGQKFEVMELIAQLRDLGKTVVMVIHDLPLAFACSHQVAVLEQGALACVGPAEDVFESGVPARVFGVTCRKAGDEYLFLKRQGQN